MMRKYREFKQWAQSIQLSQNQVLLILPIGILIILLGTWLLRIVLATIFGWSE